MYFELYTKKPVRECMIALYDRLHASETKTRPLLDGYIEKGGYFSLSLTSKVVYRFYHRTRLKAYAETTDDNITRIQGNVAQGASKRDVGVLMALSVAIAAVLGLNGNALLGMVPVLVGAALYVPLVGDHQNSSILLDDLRKTLRAKDEPPKR